MTIASIFNQDALHGDHNATTPVMTTTPTAERLRSRRAGVTARPPPTARPHIPRTRRVFAVNRR